MKNKISLLLLCIIAFSSCQVVKEYEKVYLNDPDMMLGLQTSDRYETICHSYREGASGANGGKTGGGCGCN